MRLFYSLFPSYPSPVHVLEPLEPIPGFGSLALPKVRHLSSPTALHEPGALEPFPGFGLLASRSLWVDLFSSMVGEFEFGPRLLLSSLTSKRPPSMDGYLSAQHSYLTSRGHFSLITIIITNISSFDPATAGWSLDWSTAPVYSSPLTLCPCQLTPTCFISFLFTNRSSSRYFLLRVLIYLVSLRRKSESGQSKVGTVRSGASLSGQVRSLLLIQSRINWFIVPSVSVVSEVRCLSVIITLIRLYRIIMRPSTLCLSPKTKQQQTKQETPNSDPEEILRPSLPRHLYSASPSVIFMSKNSSSPSNLRGASFIFSPPRLLFPCAMNSKDSTVRASDTPRERNDTSSTALSFDVSKDNTNPLADTTKELSKHFAPEDSGPVKEVTITSSTDQDQEEAPRADSPIQTNESLAPEHQCLHPSGSSSGIPVPSRHDLPNTETDMDTIPSTESSPVSDEAGIIRDPENEGDAEILRQRSSGTSNITSDLDQLHPHEVVVSGPGLDPERSPSGSPTCSATGADCSAVLNNRDDEKPQTNDPPITVPLPDQATPCISPEEQEIIDRENRRMKESLAQGDAMEEADRRYSDNQDDYDADDSYAAPSSPDLRGKAGLDCDYENEWVPSSINPDLNLSKSKKRRRRQKKKEELLKQQDSLGKLLRGEQTEEDAERISTFDLGNQRRGSNLDDSVIDGNLTKKKRPISHRLDSSTFTATLNSTRHGPDFDDDSVSILRGQSDQDEAIEDDVDPQSVDKHPELDDDATKVNDDKKDLPEEDSLSSNSTGTKRKRKRNKKKDINMTKPSDRPEKADHNPRETRSRAQAKSGKGKPDDPTKPPENLKPAEIRGEKEKHPSPESQRREHPNQPNLVALPGTIVGARRVSDPPGAGADVPVQAGPDSGQVEVFKQPRPCSRSDIHRVVSKAVQKAKNKLSNNFAINTKIQHFKIVTDGDQVKRFPTINEFAPLVEVQVPEFIWHQEDKTLEQDNLVHVKTRGVIQFIILARNGHQKIDSWDTPKLEQVRDFASYLTCQIAELKLEFGTVLRWTNPWGNVTVMGLDSTDLGLLLKFRTFLTTLRYGHQYFNTFPKDAMNNNFGLSILLRSDLREFREEFLAEALFARNDLHGILETLQSETFTAADTTRAGVSKNGWRNVLLEADETFLKSLSAFTSSHWFNIGPAAVQIHGGERRAETYAELEARNKRKRFNMPPGQSLTNDAKSSINQSFKNDHQALILAKRNAKTSPTTRPGASKPQNPGGK